MRSVLEYVCNTLSISKCHKTKSSAQHQPRICTKFELRTQKARLNKLTEHTDTFYSILMLPAHFVVLSVSKTAYSSSGNSPQNYETPLVKWDHTVSSATRQRWPPRLHPNRAGWYSIYRPRKDERLSWPSWLVTYRNGLPVHRQSPIRVLIGSDVAQLR